MPTFYYAREIPIRGELEDRALHRIAFPEYGETGWYRMVTSANAFRHGTQKGVSRKLAERGFDGCCWDHGKGVLYSLKRADEQETDMRIMLESAEQANTEVGRKLRKLFAGIPVINHASIYDFYEHIGFDRKTRRYRKGGEA